MNQEKIGKFIADCRKEKELTQLQLAEKLNISNRAVSKWETGKSCPDASLMLELCDILGITVNELLSGERITMEDYKKNAELNLVTMKNADENMERKIKFLGRFMLFGYGLLGICAIAIFGYHCYLNYTDINYNGEYFIMLRPLFFIMAILGVSSAFVFDFLDKYDIVRK